MSYFLLDNPNPNGRHYYASRRGSVLACVVHITAGLEDLDGVDDHSAEKTARYAATTSRQVSWHSGSDTDSRLLLLPDSYTAFHVKGYNSRTIGHEISKTDVDWAKMPESWVAATLFQAAESLRPRLKTLFIPIRHAAKSELDWAIAVGGKPVGLIDHELLDPTRRKDPGRNFPWVRFLDLLKGSPTPPDPPEDDMKYQRFIVDNHQQYLATPEGLVIIRNQQHLGLLRKAKLVADDSPIPITRADVDTYGIIS